MIQLPLVYLKGEELTNEQERVLWSPMTIEVDGAEANQLLRAVLFSSRADTVIARGYVASPDEVAMRCASSSLGDLDSSGPVDRVEVEMPLFAAWVTLVAVREQLLHDLASPVSLPGVEHDLLVDLDSRLAPAFVNQYGAALERFGGGGPVAGLSEISGDAPSDDLPGVLHELGYELPTGLDFDSWERAGHVLCAPTAGHPSPWIVGDYIAAGLRAHGARATSAFDLFSASWGRKALLKMASIARKIPPSDRRPEISFWSFAPIAGIDDRVVRSELIEEAAIGGWSRHRITAEVRRRVARGGVVAEGRAGPVEHRPSSPSSAPNEASPPHASVPGSERAAAESVQKREHVTVGDWTRSFVRAIWRRLAA